MAELTDFQKEYFESFRLEEEEQLAENATAIDAFKANLKNAVGHDNDVHFNYYTTSGIIATCANLLQCLDGNLSPDKEGLYRLDVLLESYEQRIFSPGYLFGKSFALMAHHNFRRSFHQINSFAPRFIELFWNLNDNNIERFIRLDDDKVKVDVDNYGYSEKDFWFGARFIDEIAKIADGTIKLRPPLDIKDHHISFFFADTYALDIKWSTFKGIKTFYAEEIKTISVKISMNGAEFYPVRYLHAEYLLDEGYFRHFDGAIHFYTEEEYFMRRDTDLNFNEKNESHIKTRSEKLFKMNGKISIDTFMLFTSHFLAGNPLVFEYFEGKYPDYLVDKLQLIRETNK